MHVTVQRTGGFTGIPFTKELDTSAMSPEDASQLRHMVETADFFGLPSVIPGAPQPDRFQYQITIVQDGGKHSVAVSETTIPSELKPLLNWLMEHRSRSSKYGP